MIEHLNKDGFIWWQGVVVDRNDPFKIGRCKVRILGYHGEKEDIPDDDLPWAYPAMPINVRPNSVATGLVEGVWVLGFFRDGNSAQEPVITHLINYGKARDDDSYKPAEKTLHTENFGKDEMNTNKLARGESVGTIIDEHNSVVNLAKTTCPPSPYAAQFPHNYVEESESGHVIQIDDTENAERLSVSHRTGTFVEVHPDGTQVAKIVGDRFTLILGNDTLEIKGDINIKIDGNVNIDAKHKIDKVDGDQLETIEGGYNLTVKKDKLDKISGDYEIRDAKNVTIRSGNTNINSPDGTTIKGGVIHLN